MFKDDSVTKIHPDHFGAGSVVSGGGADNFDESFLVIRTGKRQVALLRNSTFEVIGKPVDVQDPNFLTSNEARTLVNYAGILLNWTFTDFFISTSGMKDTLFSRKNAK